MPMTASFPFTEYTFYDIFQESGLASLPSCPAKHGIVVYIGDCLMEVEYKQ